jgi:uncharacterized membrane protein YgaE (UPF0421/DUF939 family)
VASESGVAADRRRTLPDAASALRAKELASTSAAQARQARARLRRRFWPVIQTAIAAGVAWYLSHDVLGHAQPFFAPIAAAVSLGASSVQRSRRAVQMVLGVTLGIGVGELAVGLLGTGAVPIGAVVLVAMGVAVLAGGGFIGSGMMFVNQSASSAILVIALHRSGTGAERLVDAFVGGGIALVTAAVLFPSDPLRVLGDARHQALEALAGALENMAARLDDPVPADVEWTLGVGQDVHAHLAALADARRTAREITRVAPRRWRLRASVAAEDHRAAHVDLLANAVLSLVRAVAGGLDEGEPLAPELSRAIWLLASSLHRLADHGDAEAIEDARRAAEIAGTACADTPRQAMITSLVDAGANDVTLVAGDESTSVDALSSDDEGR